jgi:hypothetical protein
VIGLFLAMVDLPDFGTPLRSIAGSVRKLAGGPPEADPVGPPNEAAPHAASAPDAENTDPAKSEVQGHA